MGERRDSEQARLPKLGILLALALAGQFVTRWIAGRYVTNLGAPAQSATIAMDVLLVACIPFGFVLAPRLSLPGTPLLDGWIRRESGTGDLRRTLYRSLMLALLSLAAGLLVLMLWRSSIHTASLGRAMPMSVGMVLAIAAAFREEIEFRLGLLTVLAWLIDRVSRAISSEHQTTTRSGSRTLFRRWCSARSIRSRDSLAELQRYRLPA